tara:strand:+ start:1928 stop:2164 length:237 start_codon:yes stop_codon:yes gene_type:complete
MKSKNIPADIRKMTIKEAQNEIKEIISSIENAEVDLKNSIELYNRMMHLNHYIQEQFRKKAIEIKNTLIKKKSKKKVK